jgi:membrane-bound serine protease (ClpP class)
MIAPPSMSVGVSPVAAGRRLLVGLTLTLATTSTAGAATVATLQLDGVISPVAVRLVTLAVERARAEGATALVVQLDTPGGLERSMRSIVRELLNAPLPVIVYVSPTGARAASAGAFITLAAHVAAMAPATNIGAAHPVAVGGGQVDKESMKKIENDAAAFVRTIARERGRNADWAEKAVRQSVSATEREALRLNIIDLVAENLPDLLGKVDGREVKTSAGVVRLATRGATIRQIEIGWRDRFLNLISDPNIAYILLMLGMLGLFFELANPGVIVPGIVGGIALILAFFAFQSLPLNYAGLLLILFGIVLLVAEIKVVSHGVLTIGGVIAVVLGSVMLIDTPEVGLRISWRVIVPVVAATTGLFVFAVSAGLRAQLRRSATGPGGLLGEIGRTRTALEPEGQVFVRGELWRAVADPGPIAEGEAVRVVRVDGLTLRVVRVDTG